MARQVHDDPPTRVVELAVNLDDVTGEQVGAAIDRLLAKGALDAWATPITMKKGRPGITLSVLTHETKQDALTKQLIADTGSLGVRHRAWDRTVLDRSFHHRDTSLGSIKIKVGSDNHQPLTAKPEFDEVVALADANDVSLHEAKRIADAAASELLAELMTKRQRGADDA